MSGHDGPGPCAIRADRGHHHARGRITLASTRKDFPLVSEFVTAAEIDLPDEAADQLHETFTSLLAQTCGGLSFSVYRAGRPVVRLHGGSVEERANPEDSPQTSWTEDTLAAMFSGTKGVVATLAAMAVDDGLLDVHAPVAEYWPEFAAAGKQDVTVAQVLSHTVGLIYTDPEPTEGLYDTPANAEMLARQEPLWEPGTKVAYHAMTYGYLVDAILHRATGKWARELVAQRLTVAHSLDIHLGLPESLTPRVAPVFRAPGYGIATFLDDPRRREIVYRMYGDALLGENVSANTAQFRESGTAAGGAFGTADSIARFYSLVDSGVLVSTPTRELFTRTWSQGKDVVNDRPVAFGLGYEVQDALHTYGPTDRAYGHSGAGGCLHGALPELGVGFSFHTQEMLAENVDHRASRLLEALVNGLR